MILISSHFKNDWMYVERSIDHIVYLIFFDLYHDRGTLIEIMIIKASVQNSRTRFPFKEAALLK